jgi:hypothetical protein
MLPAHIVRKVLLFLLLAVRVALLAGLIAKGAFDLNYFTYCTFGFVTLLLPLGIVGLWAPAVMSVYARWIFPLLVQTTLFVALAIVAVVHLNSAIYTNEGVPFGGTLTMAWLHTGDFVVHEYPALDILIVLIIMHHYVRVHVREMWQCAGTCFRTFYVFYLLFSALVPLGIYSLVENWRTRYPLPIGFFAECAMVVLIVALIGAFIALFLLSHDDIAYCAERAPLLPAPKCKEKCDPPLRTITTEELRLVSLEV